MKIILILLSLILTSSGSDFITKWNTNVNSWETQKTISLPLTESGIYNFTVDWGDGTLDHITSFDQAEVTHTYLSEGEYTVTISGKIQGWAFSGDSSNAEKILEVTQWGSLEIDSHSAFQSCRYLTISAIDKPNISQTQSLKSMFESCSRLTIIPNINTWDVSSVTDMSYMFYYTDFSSDLSSWDVRSVTDMSYMFAGTNYNGYLNVWDIGVWDVSSVADMSGMFFFSRFTGDISAWDVSGVTNMSNMFNAASFSGDIGAWDVSSVTDMSGMFYGAFFSGDIGAWDVSSVTDMSGMFYGASFSGDISTWDVSSVTNMSEMFRQSRFDGDISAWDVSNVTDMSSMFRGYVYYSIIPSLEYKEFNGDLSSWDVSSVTDMSSMFSICTFDGDLSSWTFNQNVDFSGMFGASELSTDNYDSLLLNFLEQELSFKNFSGGNSLYSAVSVEARERLINEFGWSISDGGPSLLLTSRYRLYNPNSGFHFWTTNSAENDYLGSIGWNQEGANYRLCVGSSSLDSSTAEPYFRLYNPNSGRHFWTSNSAEDDYLGVIGWNQEGINGYLFLSEVSGSIPLYRLYNPNSGGHFWTVNESEYNYLGSLGWNQEGIAGYVFP